MKPHSTCIRIFLVLIGFILISPMTSLAGQRDLTAQQLKSLLDSGQKLLLLNPLSDIEFNEGHIPGSVNIPLHTIMRTKELPKEKDRLIITYCLSKK